MTAATELSVSYITPYVISHGDRQAVGASVRLLDMRLEEPQRLVEAARCPSEDVGRVGFARIGRRVDRLAGCIGNLAVALDQGRQMVFYRVNVRRIARVVPFATA